MSTRDYRPQLATLVKAPPEGDGWAHELKFDGYRIGCRIRGDRVTLISRNGKDWTANFPEVVAAARALGTSDALLDGEVAAVLPDGRTSFQALQNAMRRADGQAAVVYFAFDLLRIDGASIEREPLAARKARLETLVGRPRRGVIRLSTHIEGHGGAFFARACASGLEGIVSKRLDRPYYHGRNSDWVKTKCLQRQELVIGGFTDPEGTRAGLGALLLGYYQDSALVFAGKVGTGFTHEGAIELRARLDRIERRNSPYAAPPPRPIAKRAHWVTPTLVCEVSFTEWTVDGMIRHPVFHGLRMDKRADEVRRERPAAVSTSAAAPTTSRKTRR
jgi:bifunctional non-homologous end joining protein LigD